MCISCHKLAFRATTIDKRNVNSYNNYRRLFGFISKFAE